MNGVQTRLKCKPNVKRCKRFVFAAHSPLLHPNTLKTKAIIHFQTDHILTRFVFPPLEIYRDAAVRNGCNAGKTFARVMFEEGMSQNLERCMDRAAGSHTDLMAFAGWFGKRLARESVRCNATRVNFSQDITIEGKKYTTRFGTVTFSTEEKKSLEERAEEIAGRLLSSGPSEDLKTLLKEAVLTGYDLQKDDFDED